MIKPYLEKARNLTKDKKNIAIAFLTVIAVGSVIHNAKTDKIRVITNEVKQEVKKMVGSENFCVDMNSMKVTRVRETQSRLTGNDLFVVYREDKEQNTFITLFEEVNNLRYNAKEYEKHIDEQKKELSK